MGSVVGLLISGGQPRPIQVETMLGAARHRGTNHEIGGSGSARLGISYRDDLRSSWLTVRDGWSVAVAGFVDNLDEIGRRLREDGSFPFGDQPAEVVLAAFRTWGEDAVKRFRGAWACLVSDGSQIWAARDHVGFKSIFYRVEEDASYWASEAKQVVAGAGIPRRPDPEAVENIFYYGMAEDSAIAGVKRLKAASIAQLGPGGRLTVQRYWDPSHLVETSALKLPEALEQMVDMVDKAVTRTIRGHDGVLLSGGIDSTTVAAFAAPAHQRIAGRPLLGLTLTYPQYPSVDERTYTEEVADYLGIPLHAYQSNQTFLGDLNYWVDLLDGPWDTLPASMVVESFEHAKGVGVRNILSGDLAEYIYSLPQFTLSHLALHGRIGPMIRWALFLRENGKKWYPMMKSLFWDLAPSRVLVRKARKNGRLRFQTPEWVDPQSTGRPYERHDLSVPARRRWTNRQIGPVLFTSSTWEANEICSVSQGVEERRPLVDVDLWEFFLSLRAEVKYPDPVPKSFVRRAMRGRLPDRVLDRRDKTAFDEYVLAIAEYEVIEKFVFGSDYRVAGVDYERLREQVEGRQMGTRELSWAQDLAKVHAFMERFS